jgi:hypothetical protein
MWIHLPAEGRRRVSCGRSRGDRVGPAAVDLLGDRNQIEVWLVPRVFEAEAAWSRADPARAGLMTVGHQFPVSATRIGSPVRWCQASNRPATVSIAVWSTAGKVCRLKTSTWAAAASSTGSGMPALVP